jgi:cytochrome c556
MKRVMLAGIAAALGLTAAVAEGDPIGERKTLMKANGAATRIGSQMAKGEVPFDAAKAKEIFATYRKVGQALPDLFPDNTKVGGETAAAPKIWDDMPGFRALAQKLSSDAEKASAATGDLESFKAAFGEVTKTCGACHQTYRINKT